MFFLVAGLRFSCFFLVKPMVFHVFHVFHVFWVVGRPRILKEGHGQPGASQPETAIVPYTSLSVAVVGSGWLALAGHGLP